MAEDSPGRPEPRADADAEDDVLGKIDQLLSRHRPRPAAAETIPVLRHTQQDEAVPIDDGIPVLTDIVTASRRPAGTLAAPSRRDAASSALILQRMEIALDAELIRLLAQIDRNDAEKARMLDRLVTELKHALPGIVRAALPDSSPDPAPSGEEGRL